MAKKKVGKHQTIPRELKPHIEWLRSFSDVTKVVCGRIENCRTAFPAGYLTFNRDEPVGFKVRGYYGAGVMDFYVYIPSIEKRAELKGLLQKRFGEESESSGLATDSPSC